MNKMWDLSWKERYVWVVLVHLEMEQIIYIYYLFTIIAVVSFLELFPEESNSRFIRIQ